MKIEIKIEQRPRPQLAKWLAKALGDDESKRRADTPARDNRRADDTEAPEGNDDTES